MKRSLKNIKTKLINGKEYTKKELRRVRQNFRKKVVFSEETKSIWYEVLDNSKKDSNE